MSKFIKLTTDRFLMHWTDETMAEVQQYIETRRASGEWTPDDEKLAFGYSVRAELRDREKQARSDDLRILSNQLLGQKALVEWERPGELQASSAARLICEANDVQASMLFDAHMSCDWGDVAQEVAEYNNTPDAQMRFSAFSRYVDAKFPMLVVYSTDEMIALVTLSEFADAFGAMPSLSPRGLLQAT